MARSPRASFPIRLLSVAAAMAVVAGLALSLVALPGADVAEATTGSTKQLAASVQADWSLASGDPGLPYLLPLGDYETQLGRQLEGARVFVRWDSNFPSSYHTTLRDRGTRIVLSVIPKTEQGTIIPWADIAAAQPGDQLHDDMVAWAEELDAFGGDVVLAFHHEPELIANDVWASSSSARASEFVGAFQTFVDTTRTAGSGVEYAYIATAWGFGQTGVRSAVSHYPGDAFVDHIGVDAYNWAECKDRNGDGTKDLDDRSLAEILEPTRQFAAAHPTKSIIIAELGVAENANDPLAKPRWIDEARRDLQGSEYDQVSMVSWFEVFDAGFPDCDWNTTSSAESIVAHCRFAHDPHFGGAAGLDLNAACGAVTWGTDEPTEVGCWVDESGPAPELTWFTAEANNRQLLVNGTWKANLTSVESHVATGWTGDDSFVLRLRGNGFGSGSTFTDLACGPAPLEAGAPQCWSTHDGSAAVLTWQVEGAKSLHILRNGSWIAKATDEVVVIDSAAGSGSHHYVLRVRGDAYGDGATWTDVSCGTVSS